jgi:hypothetical protein
LVFVGTVGCGKPQGGHGGGSVCVHGLGSVVDWFDQWNLECVGQCVDLGCTHILIDLPIDLS